MTQHNDHAVNDLVPKTPARPIWPYAVVATVLLVGWVAVWLNQRGIDRAHRVKCTYNLRQIGQGLQLYVNDEGSMPPDLGVLSARLGTLLPWDRYVCPGAVRTPPPGTAPANAAPPPTWVRQQSHYILVKGAAMSGMRLRAGGNWITVLNLPGTVIAYENPTQHGGRGINVLYHDGTVAWIEDPQARATVAALQAGTNPPP